MLPNMCCFMCSGRALFPRLSALRRKVFSNKSEKFFPDASLFSVGNPPISGKKDPVFPPGSERPVPNFAIPVDVTAPPDAAAAPDDGKPSYDLPSAVSREKAASVPPSPFRTEDRPSADLFPPESHGAPAHAPGSLPSSSGEGTAVVPFPPEAVIARFADCADFTVERRRVGVQGVTVCRLEGLVSSPDVTAAVLRPLTENAALAAARDGEELLRLLGEVLCAGGVKLRRSAGEVVADLLSGYCALLCGGGAVCCDVRGGEQRSVDEPAMERSVLGARDSFTETCRVNTALIRRRLRTSELKLIELKAGRLSGTSVGLLYINGIACPEAANALRRRLEAVDADGITSIGDLEAAVSPRGRSIFPRFLCTERPDRFSRYLLEGRVGILADGLPLGLASPGTLPEMMRVAEDRAQHAVPASVLLLLRYAALLLSLLLPALYTAVAMYHQEMIPRQLLQSIIAAKQQVPFSTAAEMLGMLAAFGLLQEAGLRLPEGMGTTVSIIGTLIVGQSAVEARVISPIAVIVVALSGIAGYTQPNQQMGAALRIWRFLLVLAAVLMGIYGLMAGLVVLLWRLCTLENDGVSYLYPLTDAQRRPLLRALLRPPLRMRSDGSEAISGRNRREQR